MWTQSRFEIIDYDNEKNSKTIFVRDDGDQSNTTTRVIDPTEGRRGIGDDF
jgi:hypothetical protein